MHKLPITFENYAEVLLYIIFSLRMGRFAKFYSANVGFALNSPNFPAAKVSLRTVFSELHSYVGTYLRLYFIVVLVIRESQVIIHCVLVCICILHTFNTSAVYFH